MPHSLDEALTLFGVDHPEGPPESTQMFSVRVPFTLAAYVVGLSENARVSRNVMCRHLLEIGVDTLMASLPDDRREEVAQAVNFALAP